MHFDPQSKSCHSDQCFLRPTVLRFVAILLLFTAAFGVRLYNIGKPPLDFSAIRQYQNAHIARGLFYETNSSVSEEKKHIARINMERMGFVLEPRIIENAAVLGYSLAGAELLWIPRVLSSIFWIVGGIFLYLTARMLFMYGLALFSTAFYLFLPFGISASRSFQPDPLMEMMLLASIFSILWHHENPSRNKLLIAAVVSALAMFIKPYCVFLIFGVFILLSIRRMGFKKTIFNINFVLFSFVSMLPSLIYYGYSLLTLTDAQDHFQGSFFPHLLLYPYFWKDWLIMIGRATGYIAFAGAFIGLFMSSGLTRTVLAGLWIGYFIYGLLFTYHIHTHDYYQLPLIPVVAFSLAPIVAIMTGRLSWLFRSKRNIMILVSFSLFLVLGIWFSIRHVQISDYKNHIKTFGAFIGVNPDFYKFISSDFEKEVKIAEEIGAAVGHGTNNVFLTSDYGRSLSYHGELSGLPWPISISFRDRKETGIPLPDKEKLFNIHYITIRTHGKYIQYSPDFFIITAFDEFEQQMDLKDFLNSNFPVLARSDDYLIFDLRKMSR